MELIGHLKLPYTAVRVGQSDIEAGHPILSVDLRITGSQKRRSLSESQSGEYPNSFQKMAQSAFL